MMDSKQTPCDEHDVETEAEVTPLSSETLENVIGGNPAYEVPIE